MTIDVVLRSATSDDRDAAYDLFAEIQQLHANALPQFFKQPENSDSFESFYKGILESKVQHIVFAVSDGKPIGYIHYFLGNKPDSIFNPQYPYGFVFQIVVQDIHRKNGIAATLINFMIEEARTFGAIGIGIDNFSFNKIASEYFENAGFIQNREFRWMDLS